MASSADLHRRARAFADELNDLLNRTVVDGPRLTTIANQSGTRFWIGYGIQKDELVPARAMAMTVSDAPPRAYLHVFHVLTIDPDGGHLTTARSDAAVYLDPDMTDCFCRYDYERDKGDGYPESHLHVHGTSSAVQRLLGPDSAGQLEHLHFPLGGRRFRPGLEDLLTFLVVEQIADGRPGWRRAVDEHRERFFDIQLRAAARRRPQIALQGIDAARPGPASPAPF